MHARSGALVAVGLVVALAFIANVGSAMAPGRAAGRIYGDGELWATFVTTGLKAGPEGSFNLLYSFPGTGLISVTDSVPGDVDYRGGRWRVFAVTFTGIEPTQFTNDADVLHHAALGHLLISAEPVSYVSCPLFRL